MAAEDEHDRRHEPDHDHGQKLKPEYFLPDHITLYLDHPYDETINVDENKARLAIALRDSIGIWGTDAITLPDQLRIVTIHRPRAARARSMVRVTVRAGKVTETVLRRGSDPIAIADIGDPDKEVRLGSVSPIFLMGTGSHGIAHSGPGSEPTPAEMPQVNPDKWNFRFTGHALDAENSPLPEEGGDGITVVLLDTAPSRDTLANATGVFNTHPLAARLLPPDTPGKLQIHRDWEQELHELNYGAGVEAYDMSDHGLFAAGIVATIAPKATLHLFEVQNNYGVGTIETLAEGLLKALEMQQSLGDNPPRMLVNCSLMLYIPDGKKEEDNFPSELADAPALSFMHETLGEIVTMLSEANITILAAAGNDAKGKTTDAGHVRPELRYPAAYDGVIGVGAVKRPAREGEIKAADYSNESVREGKGPGRPARPGIATLGGEKGNGQGVLGIYVGGIPRPLAADHPAQGEIDPDDDHPIGRYEPDLPTVPSSTDPRKTDPSATGWAWWAGTSFATPIVTGLLARLQGAGGPLGPGSDDAAELRNRATVDIPRGGLTEHVITVEQGGLPLFA